MLIKFATKRILIINNQTRISKFFYDELIHEGYAIRIMKVESLDLSDLDISSDDLVIINLHPDGRLARDVYQNFKLHFPNNSVLVLKRHHTLESLIVAITNIFRQQVSQQASGHFNGSRKYS